jgi:hypothetical protein
MGGRVTNWFRGDNTSLVRLGEAYDGVHDKLSNSSTSLEVPCSPRRLAPWPTCQSSPSCQSCIRAWSISMVGLGMSYDNC